MEPTNLDNILDLIFCSPINLCFNLKILPPFTRFCNHNCVEFLIMNQFNNVAHLIKIVEFHSINFPAFVLYLHSFYREEFFYDRTTVDEFYKKFCIIIIHSTIKFVPYRKPFVSKPFKSIFKLQAKCFHYWMKYHKSQSLSNKQRHLLSSHRLEQAIN